MPDSLTFSLPKKTDDEGGNLAGAKKSQLRRKADELFPESVGTSARLQEKRCIEPQASATLSHDEWSSVEELQPLTVNRWMLCQSLSQSQGLLRHWRFLSGLGPGPNFVAM